MTCRVCLAENPSDARFCKNCGAPPDALPDALPSAPVIMFGERKVVTISFADVVGSTAMAEHVDPEDWTDIMDGATRFMTAAVTRYEGTVGRLALSPNGFECVCRGLYLRGMGRMAASEIGPAVNDFERAELVGTDTAYEPWPYDVRAASAGPVARQGAAVPPTAVRARA